MVEAQYLTAVAFSSSEWNKAKKSTQSERTENLKKVTLL